MNILCAITSKTEISLTVRLNNQIKHKQQTSFLLSLGIEQKLFLCPIIGSFPSAYVTDSRNNGAKMVRISWSLKWLSNTCCCVTWHVCGSWCGWSNICWRVTWYVCGSCCGCSNSCCSVTWHVCGSWCGWSNSWTSAMQKKKLAFRTLVNLSRHGGPYSLCLCTANT